MVRDEKEEVGGLYPKDFDFFLLHGWMMWGAWTLFAFVQIVTNRYGRGKCYGFSMWVHIISGWLITVMTGFFAISAYSEMGWWYDADDGDHLYYAFPVLYGVLVIVIAGTVAQQANKFVKWNTSLVLWLKFFHKLLSYLLMIEGFIAIFTGIKVYRMWH